MRTEDPPDINPEKVPADKEKSSPKTGGEPNIAETVAEQIKKPNGSDVPEKTESYWD